MTLWGRVPRNVWDLALRFKILRLAKYSQWTSERNKNKFRMEETEEETGKDSIE